MGGQLRELAPYLIPLIAGLTFSFLLFAGWISFWWWQRTKGVYYALTTGLLLIGSVILLLATFSYRNGWMGSLTALIVTLLVLRVIWLRHKEIRPTIIAGLIPVLICGTLLPLVSVNDQRQSSYKELQSSLGEVVTQLRSSETELSKRAEELSLNSNLDTALGLGATTAVQLNLQSLLVQNELQILTVTDKDGIVVARGHSGDSGDSITATFPWMLTVLQGNPLVGKSYTEAGIPMLIAAQPIVRNGVQSGTLLIGKTLDSRFTGLSSQNSAYAVGGINGLTGFTVGSATEITLLSSSALDSAVRNTLSKPSIPERIQFFLTLNNQRYRVVGHVLSTLNTNQPVILLTLNPAQQEVPTPFTRVLTIASISLLALGIFLLLRKEAHASK